MVLVQNWPSFRLFIEDNIGQENVFYDILKGKKAFLGYKNQKFKKPKIKDFCKVVRPWFRSQSAYFSIFLF